jgi:hypothetical protein
LSAEVRSADTDAILDTQTLKEVPRCKYLVWDLKGNVKLRFTKTGGLNVMIGSIFFDPVHDGQ